VADEPTFAELIRRVRARDEQAAAELVRRYEPAIRLAVRVRLTSPGLRRHLDSMDVCQSVLANFFVRAALGQFDLEKPDQLLRLLATMARNKVMNHARYERAARRDYRRLEAGDAEERDLASSGPTASQVVANQELLEAVRDRLQENDRVIADQRARGRSWVEIASELGGEPDSLRIRFSRAIDRVATALQLDD
jgi:RNA polymerase sigma-70 factor (ECF subfamily)